MLILIDLLVLILFIYILWYLTEPQIEGYDDQLNVNIDQCGEFCRGTAGCYGFGFDNKNNKCYPSKTPVTPDPSNQSFGYKYDKDQMLCNKVTPIQEPTKVAGFEERRKNAAYVCSEKENVHPTLYYQHEKKFNKIDEGQNIDFIGYADEYEINPYDWPESAATRDNVNDVVEYRQRVLYGDKYVTDIRRRSGLPVDDEKEIDPDQLYDVEGGKKGGVYQIEDKRVRGEYMRPFKCVKDITLRNCMEYCNNREECVGFEYNPQFKDSQAVCCPMKSADMYLERKPPYENGKFYKKDQNHIQTSTKTYTYYN